MSLVLSKNERPREISGILINAYAKTFPASTDADSDNDLPLMRKIVNSKNLSDRDVYRGIMSKN